jgi:hypothetical protein
MFGLLEVLLFLPLVGLGLLAFAFWVWMLVECATKEASTGNDKLIWVLVLLFTHLLGALLYFFIRRSRRKAELGA